MKDPMLPEDPINTWPEEVKKAYESLAIPSLYDCVVANEKLSLEMHKQTRDIKEVLEGVNLIATKLNSVVEFITEEVEFEGDEDETDGAYMLQDKDKNSTFERDLKRLENHLFSNQDAIEQKARGVLIEVTDTLIDLSKNTKQLASQLMELLPKKEGLIPHAPSWHKLAEEIITSLVDGVDTARYRLMAKLTDVDIEIIEPRPGDLFTEQKHRALEKLKGGKPGTIARIVRVGYEQDDEVLRPAEVIVYTN